MTTTALPDVVSEIDADTPLPLRWVGMEGIAVPLQIASPGAVQSVSAKASLYVSLESPQAKGIHMSRLYALLAEQATEPCTRETLSELMQHAIASQNGIGYSAKLALGFDLVLSKPALLSDELGHQAYPVVLHAEAEADGHAAFEIELTLPYSSTCPCSAALARQLLAHAIDTRVGEEHVNKGELLDWVQSQAGSIATPHSQRSYLYLRIAVGKTDWPDLPELIRLLEATLATPVQTAVKRRDEQEFARLNAENLMFCEDAARRVKAALEQMPCALDYWFKVEHQESLHAHNAVVIDCKHPPHSAVTQSNGLRTVTRGT